MASPSAQPHFEKFARRAEGWGGCGSTAKAPQRALEISVVIHSAEGPRIFGGRSTRHRQACTAEACGGYSAEGPRSSAEDILQRAPMLLLCKRFRSLHRGHLLRDLTAAATSEGGNHDCCKRRRGASWSLAGHGRERTQTRC